MIPMRHSTIFKSRWMALLWAAGILWFAYQFAAPESPSDAATNETDASGASLNAQNAAQVGEMLNQL